MGGGTINGSPYTPPTGLVTVGQLINGSLVFIRVLVVILIFLYIRKFLRLKLVQ